VGGSFNKQENNLLDEEIYFDENDYNNIFDNSKFKKIYIKGLFIK